VVVRELRVVDIRGILLRICIHDDVEMKYRMTNRRLTGGKKSLWTNPPVATSRAPIDVPEPEVSPTGLLRTIGKKLQTAVQHARREPGYPLRGLQLYIG